MPRRIRPSTGEEAARKIAIFAKIYVFQLLNEIERQSLFRLSEQQGEYIIISIVRDTIIFELLLKRIQFNMNYSKHWK